MDSSLVLMFHDVVNQSFPNSGFKTEGAKRYKIDEDRFRDIIRSVIHHDKNVSFSFDDGGNSFYNVIAPILENYGLKGIFFISTKYIETPGFLTKAQIIDLNSRGHVIASHSHSHPKIISNLSDSEIMEEWCLSKEILEGIINNPVTIASIPGGAVSKRVIDGAIKAGYKLIYTSEPSVKIRNVNDVQIKGRFTISRNTSSVIIYKILKVSSYRYRLILRYKILRSLKILLGSNYNRLKQSLFKAGVFRTVI